MFSNHKWIFLTRLSNASAIDLNTSSDIPTAFPRQISDIFELHFSAGWPEILFAETGWALMMFGTEWQGTVTWGESTCLCNMTSCRWHPLECNAFTNIFPFSAVWCWWELDEVFPEKFAQICNNCLCHTGQGIVLWVWRKNMQRRWSNSTDTRTFPPISHFFALELDSWTLCFQHCILNRKHKVLPTSTNNLVSKMTVREDPRTLFVWPDNWPVIFSQTDSSIQRHRQLLHNNKQFLQTQSGTTNAAWETKPGFWVKIWRSLTVKLMAFSSQFKCLPN